MNRSFARRLAGLSTVAVLALAACGDDDDTTDTTAAQQTTVAPSTTEGTTSPSSTTGGGSDTTQPGTDGPATGEPIKIGLLGTFSGPGFDLQELLGGAEVAVEALNERGGVNGRPVEIVECNDEFDAAKASACYRQMADDEEVVALVGGGSAYDTGNAELLNTSELPIVGPTTSGHALMSEFAVATNGGTQLEYSGQMVAAQRAGASTVSVMRLAGPFFDQIEAQIRAVAGAVGVEVVDVVGIDVTTVDLSPTVQALIDGNPDAVTLTGLETQIVQVITQLKQAGYEGQIITPLSQTRREFVESLGENAEGVLAVSAMAPVIADDADTPGLNRMREEVQEHQPDMKLSNYATTSWLAVQVFAEAAQSIDGDVTRQSVLQALKSISDFDSGGVVPTLDFTQPGPIAAYPALPHNTVAILEGRAPGSWSWDGEFVPVPVAA